MKRLIISLMLLGASLSWAAACPFCNPGEADLFSDIEGAQAVVLAEKLDTRKYKITEVWKGDAKAGKVVLAGEPQGKLGKKGRFLLTTAGAANLPYWSDAPRILDAAELAFAKEALAVSKQTEAKRWDFACRHLESPSGLISEAAYNLLAAAPFKEVAKRRTLVGVEQLAAWSRNSKIPDNRRALYLLMGYKDLKSSDLTWIEQELMNSSLSTNSPFMGPLVTAFCHLGGTKALARVETQFYKPEYPPTRVTPLNRALTLCHENTSDPVLKKSIRQLFIRELENPQRGAFVLGPLAIWQEFSVSPKVEKLAGRAQQVTWVKVAVIRFFRSFATPESAAALNRLKAIDKNLVETTKDGYRRSDLGID